jgi:cytochrome P450
VHARAILTASDDVLEPNIESPLGPVLGETSILLTSGDRHRRIRRLLRPPFLPGAVKPLAESIQEAVALRLEPLCSGDRFSAHELGRTIALDVIIRIVFGVVDSARVHEFTSAIRSFVDAYIPLLIFVPATRRSLAGFSPWDRFLNARNHLDSLLDEQIVRERDAEGERGSMLAQLVGVSEGQAEQLSGRELRDQLLTLLFAGQSFFYVVDTCRARRVRH